MADVSKIKLPNGTTLDIKDGRITGIDSTPTSSSGNVVTSGGVYTALATKSGVPFYADEETTVSELEAAIAANRPMFFVIGTLWTEYALVPFVGHSTLDERYVFAASTVDTDGVAVICCSDEGEWSVDTYDMEVADNKVTSLSSSSTDVQYPSAKCVYDGLAAKYEKPSGGIPASDLASGVIPSVPVQDVTVGGTSVLSGSTAVIPAIPAAQIQSDWTQTDTSSKDFIKNKPSIDTAPTSASTNLVTSGGVYTAIAPTFVDASSSQDGSVVLTKKNGDTVTIDLNHVHPQYPEYEHLEDESEMPATPDENTLYLIDGIGGGSSKIVHLDDESEMPVSPDPDTLYVIDETGGGSGYETTSNKVTSLSSSSTDEQYPSAKCVYDLVGDIETLLAAL